MSTSGRGLDYSQEYDPQRQKEREEREAREALEVERLQQLADEQVSPSDYHGTDLIDGVYSGTDYSFQPEPSYYRPPTGYGEDADIPPDYYELFGTSHPQNRLRGLNLYYSLTGDDYSHENDYTREYLDENVVDVSSAFGESQINAIKGTPVPYSQKEDPQGKQWRYYSDLFKEGLINADASSLVTQFTGTEYVQPTSFGDAQLKGYNAWADTIKKERLNHEQGSEEWNELTDILKKGPMDFTGPNDVQILRFNSPKAVQEGYRAQANVMKDYLQSSDIDMYKEVDDPNELVAKDRVWLVTGTALPWFEDNAGLIPPQTNWASQDIGSYGMWENEVRPATTAEELAEGIGILMDFLSFYPPIAPIAQTLKNYAYTEDWGEAITTGAKVYAAGELAEIGNAEVGEILTDAGIDISVLPVPAQEIVLDTTTAILQGESGTDAAKKAATGEAVGAVVGILPDIDTPEIIKGAGDVVVDVLKPPLEFVGETFEPVVGGIEEGVKTVGEIGQDIIDPADEVIDTIGDSDIVEAIEEGGKAVGEVGQDIIDTGSEITSEVEDAVKATGRVVDDIVDWESLLMKALGLPSLTFNMAKTPSTGMLSQPTEVEEIFDDELFKFDTKIKRGERGMFAPVKINRRYG